MTDCVRSFIKNFTHKRGTNYAYAMIVGDTTIIVTGGACHSMFREVVNPVVLGSGFYPSKDQMEIAKKLWDWVTDIKTSPWKKLMVNGIELVNGSDDLPNGFILPQETLRSTPFNFQKNFCILMRVFTEKYPQFIIWDELVSKGMDKADALYLCGAIVKTGSGYATNTEALSGAHWPLTDGSTYYSKNVAIDFNALRTGEVHFENKEMKIPTSDRWFSEQMRFKYEPINGYFQSRKKESRVRFNPISFCKQRKLQGKFIQSMYYDLDDIINGFYIWQKKEGLLRVED